MANPEWIYPKHGENTEFLDKGDPREENVRLAMRMFLRELRALKIPSVEKVFKRWTVNEIEHGDTVRLGILFPPDVPRYQWVKTEGFRLDKVHGDCSVADRTLPPGLNMKPEPKKARRK